MEKQLNIRPAFKTLVPPLSPQEYDQLEQNLLAHGCRDPIAIWRGKIVDGHNRYKICKKHGIAFETIKLRFPSLDAAKLWILENQLGRRNLTDAMRIEIAAKKVALMGRLTGDTTYTRKKIAQAAKFSEQKVQHYMQIKAKGDPDLVNKVMTGDMKIGAAYQKLGAAQQQIEVITTTVEELYKQELGPKDERSYSLRCVVGNLKLIENLFGFMAKHFAYCGGASEMDVLGRLDLYIQRLSCAHSCVYLVKK